MLNLSLTSINLNFFFSICPNKFAFLNETAIQQAISQLIILTFNNRPINLLITNFSKLLER